MKLAIFAGALTLAAQAAAAAPVTLNFLGLANVKEQSVEAQAAPKTVLPSINPLSDATFVPIATSAFGYLGAVGDAVGDLNAAGAVAYLDGNDAGLGVCKTANASRQCAPSSDDNTQLGEVLGLTWTKSLRIESLFFRGEKHPNDSFIATDTISYSVDSGLTWFTTHLVNAKVGPVAINKNVLAGDVLLLTTGKPNDEQFYLSAASVAAVPVPPALALLAGGLGLLGLLRRRAAA